MPRSTGRPAILARYAKRDDRLVILHTPININHSNAINAALKIARGKFGLGSRLCWWGAAVRTLINMG
jgi:glycosyltransferase involved in cell wall biosynthesis